ncbi:Peptide methionine sulfoxide reductase MsrA [Aquimixticola soesokkakensis]|uniref:Peptide methionine sulfoxide reductase MsrA n=1 Tax=Aquimixticola soesokkakensis TaxID=1519096 RepID=A0A1Y5S5A1_9RHOB|nr:peptide-methionine (S)-S-oxide reductase MsrA [Aquimixticola soesokkakensis]SLN32839.1 Peptide methionine sulfoxide reductase MsrA [Aquimixticola soesokkakensis]
MFGLSLGKKDDMVAPQEALVGRETALPTAQEHFVFHRPLKAAIPDGFEEVVFGMGCFWGVERLFWTLDGVYNTAAGYAGGYTPNPTYEEVCSGRTGHTEVVRVVFDPAVISFPELLRTFWEGHDPTQGMRQGNDRGTQYRSAILTTSQAQAAAVEASRLTFQERLAAADYGTITTEFLQLRDFFFAEAYHQQYLAKNPAGYCGLGGTGVTCPIGIPVPE